MKPSSVTPQNPLKEIRRFHKLTLDRVAADLHTTRQYIIRVEQGVYADPPYRYMHYLLDLGIPDELSHRRQDPLVAAAVGGLLNDEILVYHLYKEFQSATRKKNFGVLLTDYDFTYDAGKLHQHPFVSWRWASSIQARIGVSKLYCVHPALISKFESSPNLCATPPGELIAALEESGYDKELLASFVKAYDNYKDTLSRKFRKLND